MCSFTMGSYLNKPVTEKHSFEGRNNRLSYGACTMQGWRRFQEDAFDCNMHLRKNAALFAVYDGHGGVEVATYCKENFPSYIRKHWKDSDLSLTLENAVLELDYKIRLPSTKFDLENIVRAFAEELADRKVMQHDVSDSEEGNEHDQNEESEDDAPLPDRNSILKDVVHMVKDIVSSANNEQSDSDDDGNSDAECDNSESSANCVRADQSSENNSPNETETQGANEEDDDDDDAEVEKNVESDNDHEEDDDAAEVEKNVDSDNDHNGYSCGTTAVLALLTETRLYVANVGDSRCVLSRSGRAFEMTTDHKPTLPEERERILKAGGSIVKGRVCGSLALSRAIGDHSFKSENLIPPDHMVTCMPDVKVVEMNPETDEFFFLATDGVWDVLSSEEATDFIRKRLGSMSLSAICEEMFNTIMAPVHSEDELGLDNMTCIIVKPNFPHSNPSSTVASDKRSLSDEEEDDDEVNSSSKKRLKTA